MNETLTVPDEKAAPRRIVICRHDASGFGEAPRFDCTKSISRANAYNLCADHLARLTNLWPSAEPLAPGELPWGGA